MTEELPTPVAVEPVRARMHAGMSVAPSHPDSASRRQARREPAIHRPPSAAGVAHVLSHEAIPVAAGTAVLIAARDPILAVAGGGAVLAVLTLRDLAARVPFGFGDAFVGFRSDNGWPRGVQEDDDFQWSWSRPVEADTEADRVATAR